MSIVWSGVDEFVAALDRVATRTSAELRAAAGEMAGELEKQAKLNASGRPGPEVVTGTLRRGITHDPVTPYGVAGWQTKVGPTVIYSRRIELGFHGADSLGRVYNQPGYPYFLPAVKDSQPRLAAIFARHVAAALTG